MYEANGVAWTEISSFEQIKPDQVLAVRPSRPPAPTPTRRRSSCY